MVIRLLLNSLALLIVSYIVPGFHVSSFWAALITAIVLGIINLFIKPLILILTLPVTVLTFGLFTFVINALMILLASSIVKGFTVDGFWVALVGGVLLWIVNVGLNSVIRPIESVK